MVSWYTVVEVGDELPCLVLWVCCTDEVTELRLFSDAVVLGNVWVEDGMYVHVV